MRARHAALTTALALLALPAAAADFPVLRGTHAPELPPPPMIEHVTGGPDWNGAYVGAFGAATSTNARARNTLDTVVNGNVAAPYNVLASSVISSANRNTRTTAFGAFVGYNVATSDTLLGIEADIAWMPSRSDVALLMNGGVATNGVETATVNFARSITRIDQMGTLRGRAGLVYGNFLPYVTGGFAWANGSIRDTASLTLNPGPPGTVTVDQRRDVLMTGFTIGAGLEAMFGPVLVRGEYLFTTLNNSRTGRVDLNQARLGAGVKF